MLHGPAECQLCSRYGPQDEAIDEADDIMPVSDAKYKTVQGPTVVKWRGTKSHWVKSQVKITLYLHVVRKQSIEEKKSF